MSLSFMQPLPEFRFSCFNSTKSTKYYSCFLRIRLMKNSTHSYLVSSIPSSLQRNTLWVEFKVHSTKPKTFLPLSSLPTIQKTDQWNGLFIILPPPPQPNLIKAHARLKLMPLPCLSLTQRLHISSHRHSSRPL